MLKNLENMMENLIFPHSLKQKKVKLILKVEWLKKIHNGA